MLMLDGLMHVLVDVLVDVFAGRGGGWYARPVRGGADGYVAPGYSSYLRQWDSHPTNSANPLVDDLYKWQKIYEMISTHATWHLQISSTLRI